MSDTLQAEYPVKVSNLDKLMWPQASITKADLITYIIQAAPFMLSHYRDRPLTVIRFPHGVDGKSFYQKNAPRATPEWVNKVPVWSDERNDYLHYIIADTTATLIWLANQAVLEFHPWYSTASKPLYPNVLAFDLDPSVPDFDRVRKVALVLYEVLQQLGWPSVAKTSGSSGLAVYVPLQERYTYEQTRPVMQKIALEVQRRLPKDVTLERLVKNRSDLVYFDYLQHAPHKTLVGVYSPRANPLGLVSTPITWEELAAGAEPRDFPLTKMGERLKAKGDLFSRILGPGITLSPVLLQTKLDSSKILALK